MANQCIEAQQNSSAPTGFDLREFRSALGFFPTGVAVITTLDESGQPTGLTCNSFSSVSLDPPLVLWSLRRESSSINTFRRTKAFAINILAGDQSDLSGHFARSKVHDKFDGIPYQTGYAGVPLINDCVARFHCSMHQQHEAGDHIIFIGQVEQFERIHERDPLVFCKGAYMMVTQSLRELAAKGQIGPEKLTEVRELVYVGMARLACDNATDQDFLAIEATLKEMHERINAGDMRQRAALAVQFFEQIAVAAHNEILTVLGQSLTALLQQNINTHMKSDHIGSLYLPQLDPLRWKLLEALKSREKQTATSVIRDYLEYVALAKSEAGLNA